MLKLIFGFSFFFYQAFAFQGDDPKVPKAFKVVQGKAVFANFTTANYFITYNMDKKSAIAKAVIQMTLQEEGLPVFDSVTVPHSVSLDGQQVMIAEAKTPAQETTVRYINKVASVGSHTLEIVLPITSLVDFSLLGVKSAFWTSDLEERKFLEHYLPANFEFDQVEMTFYVEFIGLKNKQLIYTNGEVEELSFNHFKISYPSYFTSSSIFFHTVPVGSTSESRFSLKSIDGREIPAVVYFSKSSWNTNLDRLKAKTTEIFHELEADYGAFPHPSLVVFQAGLGGMEYCGATMTDFSALGHELFHSYFARGVMPANGNAGWIDEALASWRDANYQTLSSLSGSSRMSSHPYYTRTTDRAAYTFGMRFMSYLDGKLRTKGGLKPFMRYLVDKKIFAPFWINDFISEMSTFYGISLEADFKKFTFGTDNNFSEFQKTKAHIHQKMSLEELKKYL